MQKSRILEIIKRHKNEIQSRFEVEKLGMFGRSTEERAQEEKRRKKHRPVRNLHRRESHGRERQWRHFRGVQEEKFRQPSRVVGLFGRAIPNKSGSGISEKRGQATFKYKQGEKIKILK